MAIDLQHFVEKNSPLKLLDLPRSLDMFSANEGTNDGRYRQFHGISNIPPFQTVGFLWFFQIDFWEY